jgi:hypothetical protein
MRFFFSMQLRHTGTRTWAEAARSQPTTQFGCPAIRRQPLSLQAGARGRTGSEWPIARPLWDDTL